MLSLETLKKRSKMFIFMTRMARKSMTESYVFKTTVQSKDLRTPNFSKLRSFLSKFLLMTSVFVSA